MRKVFVLAAAVLSVLAGISTAAAASVTGPVAQADAAATPRLDWAPCVEPGLAKFQCATAAVPLDYSRPHGKKLPLAVLRQPAADPAHRIGTLFLPVGGPGGSGIDSMRREGVVTGELARRFDVVTFDQRGIGRSGQVRCFASPAEQERFWSGVALPPVTAAQERRAEADSRAHAAGCARHSGDLLGHLTTVDAARDLDLLRRAVGDAKLSFLGGSYASYLGEVYGVLFGDRVRALQLNAMIDPVGYTNATVATLAERSVGTEEVFGEFARLCAAAGRPRCAFAGGDVRARNAALLDRLKRAPIVVGQGAGAFEVRYGDVVPTHAAMLYDPERGWPALAELLAELERGAAGNPDVVREVLGAGAFRLDFLDSYTAISCADNSFGRSPGVWPVLAKAFDAIAPAYGRHWLYQLQACASWPSPPGGYPQRHTGPWTLRTNVPALLINNRFDPVTPVTYAEKARRALGNARLVVVDGHGHAPTGACVDRLRERYLIDLRLPDPGTTCSPDRPPFGGGGGGDGARPGVLTSGSRLAR
ncbi:alpha/beta hydrolase [Amycolatopsis anabasis]|uniref:alpha/beta hydrolase n=1 Tax=Amycolatopsis anabasis TaxID=1840409 RepID=UPI00131CAB12|nr:alpha/beta hydrolase [Amycolatopsis anabasis]